MTNTNYADRAARINRNCELIVALLDAGCFEGLVTLAEFADDASSGRREHGIFQNLIRFARIVQDARGCDKMDVDILRDEAVRMQIR